MRFILQAGRIDKFFSLRDDYQKSKGVNLNTLPSWFQRPTLFGGPNITDRKAQIEFLEKILSILKSNLTLPQQINTKFQKEYSLTACRTFLAACLYVQSQNNSSQRSSVLFRCIEDNLGIDADNYFDEEDIENCCLAAYRLTTISDALEQANSYLREQQQKQITEKEWDSFKLFLNHHINHEKHSESAFKTPFTSITKPFFGAVFAKAGGAVGFVLANIAGDSKITSLPTMKLSTVVGSTLLIVKPTNPAGIALLAPVIANQLIYYFCATTLVSAMSTSSRMLGQGVGIGVGMSFDLTYNLLRKGALSLRNYIHQGEKLDHDGIRITDGAIMIAGLEMKVVSEIDCEPAPKSNILGLA